MFWAAPGTPPLELLTLAEAVEASRRARAEASRSALVTQPVLASESLFTGLVQDLRATLKAMREKMEQIEYWQWYMWRWLKEFYEFWGEETANSVLVERINDLRAQIKELQRLQRLRQAARLLRRRKRRLVLRKFNANRRRRPGLH